MSDSPKYMQIRPQSFDPHRILAYVDALDKRLINAEIEYDEVKDQVNEMFDYVVNEKMTNESLSVSLAKVKTNSNAPSTNVCHRPGTAVAFLVPNDKIPKIANITINPNKAVLVNANCSPKPRLHTGVTSNCSNGE